MPVHERYTTFLEDQRRFFDELITEDWHAYRSEIWDRTRTFEVSELFARVQPEYVLDVGCGCGFHDQAMAQHPFVRQVDAVDYSAKSIERANEAYPHPKVRRWTASYADLRPERPYDLVTSFQVIEHLKDPADFLRACSEYCRVGGHVAVFMPNRLRVENRILGLSGKPPQLCDPMHFTEYAPGEVERMALPFGLVGRSWFGIGFDAPSIPLVRGWGIGRRLAVGRHLKWMASGLGIVMEKVS